MSSDFVVMGMAAFFLAVGVAGFFFPEKLQRTVLQYYMHHPGDPEPMPFWDWIKTRSYVRTMRLIGVAGIGAFCLIAYLYLMVPFCRG